MPTQTIDTFLHLYKKHFLNYHNYNALYMYLNALYIIFFGKSNKRENKIILHLNVLIKLSNV